MKKEDKAISKFYISKNRINVNNPKELYQAILDGSDFESLVFDKRMGEAIYEYLSKQEDNEVTFYILGSLYYYGIGVDKDEDKGIYYIKKAESYGLNSAKSFLDKNKTK